MRKPGIKFICKNDCSNEEIIKLLGPNLTVYHFKKYKVYDYYPDNRMKYKHIYLGELYKGGITEDFLLNNFIYLETFEKIIEEVDNLYNKFLINYENIGEYTKVSLY